MELGHGGNLCVPTTSLQFQPANHVVLSVPATGGKELLGICAFPSRRETVHTPFAFSEPTS
jgi:hypothetical protein